MLSLPDRAPGQPAPSLPRFSPQHPPACSIPFRCSKGQKKRTPCPPPSFFFRSFVAKLRFLTGRKPASPSFSPIREEGSNKNPPGDIPSTGGFHAWSVPEPRLVATPWFERALGPPSNKKPPRKTVRKKHPGYLHTNTSPHTHTSSPNPPVQPPQHTLINITRRRIP